MSEKTAPSSWGPFLKELARVGMSADLSTLTAPPFILSPTSLIEYTSYWAETPQFLSLIKGTEEERMLAVLEWCLSTFAGQFTAREKATGTEKKPLNPFLGEQFIGKFTVGEGVEIVLNAEQVSHHPPLTAYNIDCASKGISFEGHCAQKTSFSSGAIVVKQIGHGIIRLRLPSGTEETYLVTLPKLQVAGLFYGAPYVELSEKSYIQASTGYQATIEYKGKGYFSGKSHSFVAHVASPAAAPLYTIEGQWTGTSTFTAIGSAAANAAKVKVGAEFADFETVKRHPIEVKPVEEMGEYESRKVWKDVSAGIRSGAFDVAQAAKVKIETAERQKRKDELAAGKVFETRLFKIVSDDPVYRELAAKCQHKPANEESYKLIKR